MPGSEQVGSKNSFHPKISAPLARGSALLLKLPAWTWGLAFLALLGLSSLVAGGGGTASSGLSTNQPPSILVLGLSVLFKLGLVIVLIFASMILFRRWRVTFPARPDRQISILETARLSPRQAIHLVLVRDQVLLIGATDQGLALLTEFDGLAVEKNQVETLPVSFEQRLGGSQGLLPPFPSQDLFPVGKTREAS